MVFAFMALAYTCVLCVLVLMNGQLCRLVRILSVILKDAAYISSKVSGFDQCRHNRIISMPKCRQMAYLVYIP